MTFFGDTEELLGAQEGVFASQQEPNKNLVQEAGQFLRNMRPENSQALLVAGLSLLDGQNAGKAGINALGARNQLIQQNKENEQRTSLNKIRESQLEVSRGNLAVNEFNAVTQRRNSLRPPKQTTSEFERLVAGFPEAEQKKLRQERAKNMAANRSEVVNPKPVSPSGELDLRALEREYDSSIKDVDTMISAIAEDPTLAGLGLTARKGGQTVTGIIEDAGSLLPESFKAMGESVMSRVAEALNKGEMSQEDADSLFNDARVSRARLFENQLAFVIARTRQPRGRLLASTINAAREDAKLSGIISSKDVNNRLEAIKEILVREKEGIQKDLVDLAPSRSHPEVKRKFRIVNGQLEEVQ